MHKIISTRRSISPPFSIANMREGLMQKYKAYKRVSNLIRTSYLMGLTDGNTALDRMEKADKAWREFVR